MAAIRSLSRAPTPGRPAIAPALWDHLCARAPRIAVSAANVSVLAEPPAFYTTLLDGCASARRRIVLSSLYLGNEQQPRQLVSQLEQACALNAELRVTILLDALRGTRGSHARNDSVSLLRPLLDRYPERVRLMLWHTPLLRSWAKRLLPESAAEVIGVQHVKAYIFDDDTLLTGANLNESYFTLRQDRYVLFRRTPALAEYFAGLIELIGGLSFQYRTGAPLRMLDGVPVPYAQSEAFIELAQARFEAFCEQERITAALPPSAASATSSSAAVAADAAGDASAATAAAADDDDAPADTFVFPLVQVGPIGVRQEEAAIDVLVVSAAQDSELSVTSPYLNLASSYQDLLINHSKSSVRLVTASPLANGFYGGGGIKNYIPLAYSMVEDGLSAAIAAARQTHRVLMREWFRPGWTYHAKGIWLSPGVGEEPVLTVVGSSNFGVRSAERDVEAVVVLATSNPELRAALGGELRALGGDQVTAPLTRARFADPDRRAPWWLRLGAWFVRKFL